ncbi:MAG: DUF1194 domain-containing protein [Alphaproteobacteria bacterium]|nr:DUF1194 domain-containing protein [Alphaproteobacteria bacterium]
MSPDRRTRPASRSAPARGRLGRRRLLLAAAALAAGGSARAQPATVDLALVLAADCSGSVREQQYLLQQQGTADAFRYPAIVEAILGGANAAIAVAHFHWSGPTRQHLAVPWTALRSPADIASFADRIEAAPRRIWGGGTAPGGAIEHGRALLEAMPFRSSRWIIDVSGDGRTNAGPPSAGARDAAVARGITINGLPILHVEPDIDDYYEHNVIGGPGAFLVPARDFVDFADAMRRKLIRELAADRPPRPVDSA